MTNLPGTAPPNFKTYGGGVVCEHDYVRRKDKPTFFECAKCQNIQPEHMLEEVDGVWKVKAIVVNREWKRR